MMENEAGHRPVAYVKNQQIKELLQESEQKVWFVTALYTFIFLYLSLLVELGRVTFVVASWTHHFIVTHQ